MVSIHRRIWIGAITTVVLTLVLVGCSDPQVRKQKAYEEGVELFNAGESKSAVLEFRNAFQIDPGLGVRGVDLSIEMHQTPSSLTSSIGSSHQLARQIRLTVIDEPVFSSYFVHRCSRSDSTGHIILGSYG
jgi:ABC-type molybdate transport system substrate-binding protein